ncbi:hypothetical protein MJO28_001025 [Puccinia striiformis f. sp. tritici]|uniref:Uncharacterized protein n=1 Tax=Puccinia striiformis f. sp. tritici TaxID=168172 RepID=A0ACC0F0L4_9BASI|nr:hypothetical protein MJO28_001025 [Puccinia striiformis f. sp. tritici]
MIHANAGVEKSVLIGKIVKLKKKSNTRLEFNIEEQLPEEVKKGSSKNPIDLDCKGDAKVTFVGNWCQSIRHDLQASSKLRLHLKGNRPGVNSRDNDWEFHNGIRADLLIENPDRDGGQLPFFLKTIDIGPSSDVFKLPRPQGHRGAVQSPQRTTAAVGDDGQLIRLGNQNSTSIRQKPRKRARIASGQSTPSSHLSPRHPGQPPAQANLGAATSNDDTSGPADLRAQPPTNHQATSGEQVKCSIKTLAEIKDIPQGREENFGIIALCHGEQKRACWKTRQGPQDYVIQPLLWDSPGLNGGISMICSLFCAQVGVLAPWTEAPWEVIMLWNVRNQSTVQQSTVHGPRKKKKAAPIVGPSGTYQLALWLSAPKQSDEKFYCTTSSPEEFSSLLGFKTLADLMDKARALYQSDLAARRARARQSRGQPNQLTGGSVPRVDGLPQAAGSVTGPSRAGTRRR